MILEKWKAIIKEKHQGTPWEEKEIISFRKSIGISGGRFKHHLRDMFWTYMPDTGYLITLEQQQKGTDYLLARSLKKDGTARKNSKLNAYCLSILRDKPIHRLTGVKPLDNGIYLPMYTAIGFTTGKSFKYIGATYEQLKVLNTSGETNE